MRGCGLWIVDCGLLISVSVSGVRRGAGGLESWYTLYSHLRKHANWAI